MFYAFWCFTHLAQTSARRQIRTQQAFITQRAICLRKSQPSWNVKRALTNATNYGSKMYNQFARVTRSICNTLSDFRVTFVVSFHSKLECGSDDYTSRSDSLFLRMAMMFSIAPRFQSSVNINFDNRERNLTQFYSFHVSGWCLRRFSSSSPVKPLNFYGKQRRKRS